VIGVGEVATRFLRVWPNPAREELRINLPEGCTNGRIELFNSLGSLVASETAQGSVKVLDVRALPAGTYFLRFQHGSEWIIASCIIE
jgi:hypothetical protein